MTTVESTGCLNDNELNALAEEALPSDRAARAWAHLASCDDCATLFNQLMNHAWADLTTQPFQLRTLADPLEGRRDVGRYRVIDLIARGGMGVVYLAYDPELDRRVALKVLPPTLKHDEAARGRMAREAQALARLAHPNVTAVYDVGTVGDSVFFAMEFVEGQTLSEWLASPRPWRDVVHALLQAGAGLEAAHQAGLVHRDFKPSNVLVGDDGHVRVTDFGIAKALGEPDSQGTDALCANLTREGMVSGTVGYIAPELMRGGEATAASDQFSFCISLYEGLCRRRPFRGATLAEVTEALSRPLEAPTGIPRWLDRVVRRGLARAPAKRFHSLGALLDELRSGLRRRRRVLATVIVGLLVLATGTIGAAIANEKRKDCLSRIGSLPNGWDTALHARWVTSVTNVSLRARLERHTKAFLTERDAACGWFEARTSTREQCLAAHRLELEATIAVVTERSTLVRSAVDALEEPSRCQRAQRGTAAVSPELARAIVASRLEDWNQTTLEARRAAGLATERGDLATLARARLLEAAAQAALEQRAHAQILARATLFDALGRGDDWTSLEACLALAEVSDESSEVLDAVQLGKALHERLPDDAQARQRLAALELIKSRADAAWPIARRHAEQSLSELRELHGALHPSVVHALISLAEAAEAEGNRAVALATAREAVLLANELFDPKHAVVMQATHLLARLEASAR